MKNTEEYLEKMLSQIRCKKARPYISDEIRGHIEDQIADNISQGMAPAEAEEKAVADMGDPIEVGISLDHIHRPRMAWHFLIMAGILSGLGVALQQSILSKAMHYDFEPYIQNTFPLIMTNFVSSVIFGFIIMCAICFIDYTTIAKWAKPIALLIMGLLFLCLADVFAYDISGRHDYIGFGIFLTSTAALMMFYMPIYGAILYQYRTGGILSFLKAVIWLIAPVYIAFRLPSLTIAGILMIGMLVQLTVAVRKGWFRLPVKRTIAVLWSAFLILPTVLLFLLFSFDLLTSYQETRIRTFLLETGEQDYITHMLRTFCRDIPLFGSTGNDVIGSLPDFNSHNVFIYIINSYGGVAGILVIAVLALLVVSVFAASVKQKNELGQVMGFGCGMVLFLNITVNLFSAIGVIPPTSTLLPFFSVGRGNMIMCDTLIGMMMSIYRYRDVYPRHIRVNWSERIQKYLSLLSNSPL